MTAEEYRALLYADFDDVNLEDMRDLRSVRINSDLSQEDRKKHYLKQIGNPYMVRVGNTKVKVRFADDGISFEEAFENMLMVI